MGTGLGLYATYNTCIFDYIELNVEHNPRMTSAGNLESYDYVYKFRSWVRSSSAADMLTAIGAVRTALNSPGNTLTVKNDNPSGDTTLFSFGASDCELDGPIVKYSFPQTAGFSFLVDVEVSGVVPPAGSGEIVDDYEDSYAADATGRYTWTRTGNIRNSSAYSDADDAFADCDPAPSVADWEFVSKDGKLDEDKKKFAYTWTYVEPWEEQSSQWKDSSYSIAISREGMIDRVTVSATVSPAYTKGAAEGLAERALSWAETKLPEGCKEIEASTTLDKRGGSCSVSIQAIRAADKSGVISEQESDSTRSHLPFVIHRPMNGGKAFGDIVGSPIIERTVSGRRVGLTSWPTVSIPKDAWDQEITKELPEVGVGGEYSYAISYSYSIFLNVDMNQGGGGGGGAGGGIGDGGQPSGGGGSVNKLIVGDIGGFATAGLVNRVAGGLAGNRSGFSGIGR